MLGVQSLGPVAPRCVAEPHDSIEGVAQRGQLAPGARLAADPPPPAVRDSAVSRPREPVSTAASERDAWVVLLSVPGLGPVTFGTLLRLFGSARQVLRVAEGDRGVEQLEAIIGGSSAGIGGDGDGSGQPGGIPAGLARRIVEAAQASHRVVGRVAELGLSAITLEDSDYPRRLRLVEMPPPLLFVAGAPAALNAGRMVAVVGTRWPTDKGRLTAGWIGGGLANAGAHVVSGMAVGIDGAAHAATVAEGGKTVAVLGGGHAHLFPRAHERLAGAIVAGGGAVVSELSPDTTPSRGTFPRRNRLVSGMSDAVVVVEAGRRSGALITAGWALEQGRDCYLVPGPLDAPTSAGCLAFLRAFPGQARVVCGIPELLEDLGLAIDESGGSSAPDRPSAEAPASGQSGVLASLSPLERCLAQELRKGPVTADELARVADTAPAAILSALTLLELRGLVRGSYGRYVPVGALSRARLGRGVASPAGVNGDGKRPGSGF